MPSKREFENLTKREQEVLEQLSKGYSYKEIADALAIGVETVRTHLSHAYAKLCVRSGKEAIAKYMRR